MPKGFKAEKGYATVTNFPGALDYRAIAERMSEDGDTMNHSTARNVFLRAMKKLASSMHTLYDLDLTEEALERTVKDPDFQEGVYDVMMDSNQDLGMGG